MSIVEKLRAERLRSREGPGFKILIIVIIVVIVIIEIRIATIDINKNDPKLKKEEENEMNDENKKEDKSIWAIGGGVLMGLGAGFFFLKTSPLLFVGCLLLGLGMGLVITSILSKGS